MKRLAGLLLLLTVFSLVFVVACGDDDEEEATPTKAAPAATATSKPAAPTAVPTKVMGATPQPGLPTPTAIAQEVPKDSDQAKMGGTVKAIPQASIASLDPQFAGATVSLYTASNVTESAFTRDDSLQVAPMLVDTWEISADQLTWTFTLRSGLKFHNGEPVAGGRPPMLRRRLEAAFILGDGGAANITKTYANVRIFASRLCCGIPLVWRLDLFN